jgi:hypothetical protein
MKLDWNIDANNTFTFKYNYLKSASQIPPSNSGSVSTRQASTTALPFYGAGYEIKVYDKDNVLVPKADASQWFFDYHTGILLFKNAKYPIH